MSRPKRLVVCAAAAGAILSGTASVRAQTAASSGPVQGLFAAGDAQTAVEAGLLGHFVDLTLTTYAGFDRNVTAEAPDQRRADGFYRTGPVFGWSGQSLFIRNTERATISVGAGTTQRYDESANRWTSVTNQGAIAVGVALTPRARLRAAHSMTYSPYYQLGRSEPFVFASDKFTDFAAESADFALLARPAWTSDANASLTYDTTSRTSLELTYNHQYTTFADDQLELRAQDARVVLRHKTSSTMGWHAGYSYREGRYGSGAAVGGPRAHDIELGADVDRPLPFSRRASFVGSIGSAVIPAPGGRHQITIIGDGNVRLRTGASWTTTAGAYRGVEFAKGLGDALLINGVAGRISGLVTRRVDVSLVGDYARGTVGGIGASNRYATYSGSSQVRIALTRNVALYVAHLYYHYEFGEMTALPVGLAQTLNRHGARVGLTLWRPLVRR